MDRPVKISEFLSMIFGLIVTLVTLGYTYGTKTATMQTELTSNTVRINEIERTQREDKQELNKKLDGMNSILVDMRLLLQEKQDRKK